MGWVISLRQASNLPAQKVEVVTSTGTLRQIIVVARQLSNRFPPFRPDSIFPQSSGVVRKNRVEGLAHQVVHLAEGKWMVDIKVKRAGGNGGSGKDGGTLWRRRYNGDKLVSTGRTVNRDGSVVNWPRMVEGH